MTKREMLRHRILIALGGNLPGAGGRPALQTCRWAIARIVEQAGLQLVATSRWYRSAPVPASTQPDYVNGVACFAGAADPASLLQILHAIEEEAGRQRSLPNAARTLDLDLLAVDDLVIDSPTLTLPHPRLADRAFVLAPLCDVAPDWVAPGGLTAAALLATVDRSGIAVLSPD